MVSHQRSPNYKKLMSDLADEIKAGLIVDATHARLRLVELMTLDYVAMGKQDNMNKRG